jgi:dolichyl-phosphate beta-glucosyltransferase
LPAFNESERIGMTLDKILLYAAECNWRFEIIVVDDGSTDETAEIVRQYIAYHTIIANGVDVAIGSRWINSELQSRRQPLHRQLLGRIFNLSLRLILDLDFKDTQCGFKAFTTRAAQALFPMQQIERWGFDPELLYLNKVRVRCDRSALR